MLLTLTPPPPNVNANAATTVAMNTSAITLSPGGMPVAAIAAAAAANASAITTFPGGTPTAAIGLNASRMNPNVTFAPLGVGNKQQNSGISACLQPTTQSDMGFSASLAGGFGATHSGSTSTATQSNSGISAGLVGGFGATPLGSSSTITGTLGSNYVPRKKGNRLMLSPYSGSINPLSLTGVIVKYINFLKLPYNKLIDCSVGNRNLVFAGLAEKAKQYSMVILWVPTTTTGKMA
jgi:hypothetical protein